VVLTLPLGRPPSDDSPMAMIPIFINAVGLILVTLIIGGGSLAQILLRTRPPRYTVFAETAWLLLIGAIIGCVTLIHD
jgi:hypothetical protein